MSGTLTGSKRKRAEAGEATDAALREGMSVRETARPYLLALAKMPLAVLDTTWSIGRNRPVDEAHVRELKRVFDKMGLERGAPEHRLQVLCSAEDVRRMESLGGTSDGGGASFLDWAAVNAGQVEVMAGQHRIQALRAFARDRKLPESELWWTCELYDRDRLPYVVNVQLRVNRRDPNLPDNHGQVWMQLASLTSDAEGRLAAPEGKVNLPLVETLRLGGDRGFPERKLVTVWNNESWRDRTTRWCETRLGLETLNISSFEWFASLRIDEYWFSAMEATLEILRTLPINVRRDVGRDDWYRIVAASRRPEWEETTARVDLFYERAVGGRRTRVDGFLTSLDDEAYGKLAESFKSGALRALPDIRGRFRARKHELAYMVRALQHVVGWVDEDCAVAIASVSRKAKNKPLIREHLSDALRTLAATRGRGEYLDSTAVRLQDTVLDHVGAHIDDFKGKETTDVPGQGSDPVGSDQYAERFKKDAWAGLLALVREAVDSPGWVLRPLWEAPPDGGVAARQDEVSSKVEAFCAGLAKLASKPSVRGPGVWEGMQRRIEDFVAAELAALEAAGEGPLSSGSTIQDSEASQGHESTPESSGGQARRPQRRALPEGRRLGGAAVDAQEGHRQKRARGAEAAGISSRRPQPDLLQSGEGDDDDEGGHGKRTVATPREGAAGGRVSRERTDPAWLQGLRAGSEWR